MLYRWYNVYLITVSMEANIIILLFSNDSRLTVLNIPSETYFTQMALNHLDLE